MYIERENRHSHSVSLENSIMEAREQFKFLDEKESLDRLKDNSLEFRVKMRALDNLKPKSYTKEYITKICHLLKKKDKNYSHKRKNIHKTTVNFDENNNLYLTLPKFDYGKRIREIINDKKKAEEEENALKDAEEESEVEEIKKQRLEDLIPEFYQNIYTKTEESHKEEKEVKIILDETDDSLEPLNEEEQTALFERLRTRKNFNKEETKDLPNIKPNITSNISRIEHVNVTRMSSFPLVKPKLSAAFSVLIKKNSKSLVESDPIIQNIKNMRAKVASLKKVNKKKVIFFDIDLPSGEKRKRKMVADDLFYYNKDLWKNRREVNQESENILLSLRNFEIDRQKEFEKKFRNNESNNLRLPKIKQVTFNSTKVEEDTANSEQDVLRLSLPIIHTTLKRISLGEGLKTKK